MKKSSEKDPLIMALSNYIEHLLEDTGADIHKVVQELAERDQERQAKAK